MGSKKTGITPNNRIFIWVGILTGVVLLIPLLAMQFSDTVNWTLFDFIVLGTLFFVTSSLFAVAAQKGRSPKQRIIIGGILFAILLLIWAELAVGLFGSPFAGS
jgi:tetrahydromethanopterin S-methyltransferase subunit F